MYEVFSTKQRIKILESIIYCTESISVNSTANKNKLSKGLVSKYFDILTSKGVLKKENGKYVVTNNSITKGIRILFNIANIDMRIFKRHQFVKSVGLYGSCAKGDNTLESDIDIWIRIEETEDEQLASLSAAINKKMNQAKVLFLTKDKIKKMQKNDELFYHSLVFSSIIVFGDSNGIQI